MEPTEGAVCTAMSFLLPTMSCFRFCCLLFLRAPSYQVRPVLPPLQLWLRYRMTMMTMKHWRHCATWIRLLE